jgi:hypothetical protein
MGSGFTEFGDSDFLLSSSDGFHFGASVEDCCRCFGDGYILLAVVACGGFSFHRSPPVRGIRNGMSMWGIRVTVLRNRCIYW